MFPSHILSKMDLFLHSHPSTSRDIEVGYSLVKNSLFSGLSAPHLALVCFSSSLKPTYTIHKAALAGNRNLHN